MSISLNLTPQRGALLRGYNNEFYGLLQLIDKSEGNNNSPGKSLNISVVLDRSGSMAGEPLIEAKKAATMMIEKMRPSDYISVVAYDSFADLIVPSTRCSDKRAIINAINEIYDRGLTDLHSGWLMGAEQVALNKSSQSINRILLLSDGMANRGVTDLDQLNDQCSQLASTNITTSTYGLGSQFNEELMVEMAKSGLGHSYYGQTSDDLLDPFNEEFQTLLNTVATEIKVVAENPLIVSRELMNNYNVISQTPEKLIFNLPDLAENGEAWALIKLSIDQNNLNDQRLEVLRCNVSYRGLDGNIVEKGPVKIELDPVNENAFSQIAEDEKVKLRITEINVARYQDRAREAARVGDWASVAFFINEARVEAKDNQWLNSVIDNLEKYAKKRQQENFSKEAM